jgi:hypothetical protein
LKKGQIEALEQQHPELFAQVGGTLTLQTPGETRILQEQKLIAGKDVTLTQTFSELSAE